MQESYYINHLKSRMTIGVHKSSSGDIQITAVPIAVMYIIKILTCQSCTKLQKTLQRWHRGVLVQQPKRVCTPTIGRFTAFAALRALGAPGDGSTLLAFSGTLNTTN